MGSIIKSVSGKLRLREKKFNFKKILTVVMVVGFSVLGINWLVNKFEKQAEAAPLVAADPTTITNCAGFAECFAFSIDTRLDATGGDTATTTTFAIPLFGTAGGPTKEIEWIINWGDGTLPETVDLTKDASTPLAEGITHDYATAGAGKYQITIRPNVASSDDATTGWFDAFGFSSILGGANEYDNKYKFLSIDTPFAQKTRTLSGSTSSSAFSGMFIGAVNAIGIPGNLFSNLDTTSTQNFNSFFAHTFLDFAKNSTDATIPAGLFDSLDTTNGSNFNSMFMNTFYNYAYSSLSGDIPKDLFKNIKTTRNDGASLNFEKMFWGTFQSYAKKSKNATIPAGLFSSIKTNKGYTFKDMFCSTFGYYAQESEVGTIPEGLFDTIDISHVSANVEGMFNYTFSQFAAKSENGSIPADLFKNLKTSSIKNFSKFFSGTFSHYAQENTTGTIPAGLFSYIDTSNGEVFESMFNSTFYNYARQSNASIPAGLFGSIKTEGGKNFKHMFNGAFMGFAINSELGTIPEDLFSAIDTSDGTDLFWMFYYTFSSYAGLTSNGIAPEGLFTGIDIAAGATTTSMFEGTLNGYTKRTAKFMVGGLQVGATSTFNSPYLMKVGVDGTPNNRPVITAGEIAYPTYSNTERSIPIPTGYTIGYDWFYKDGTDCAAATPTVDCGPQDTTTKYTGTWPNTTEWTSSTSTAKGNVVFYGARSKYTVTYDANGGSGSMDDDTATYEENFALSKNTFTKEGHTFSAWNMQAGGGGTAFADQHPFSPWRLTSGLTLYAQWRIDTYTVSFDNNCAGDVTCSTAPISQSVDYNLTATKPADPTRDHYVFEYYYDLSAGPQTAYDFASPVKSSIDLYAKWRLENFTVSFSNNCEGDPSCVAIPDQTIDYNSTITEPAHPVRAGYTFNYFYERSAGDQVPYDFSTPVTSDIELLAKWTKDPEVLPSQPTLDVPNAGFYNVTKYIVIAGLIIVGCFVGIRLITKKLITKKEQ